MAQAFVVTTGFSKRHDGDFFGNGSGGGAAFPRWQRV
jgi:hypothetical protein